MGVLVYAFEITLFGGVVDKNKRCIRVHFAQLINGVHIHTCFGNAVDKNELKIIQVFRNAVGNVEV